MIRPALISEEEIERELKSLPLWKLEGATIVREFVAANFPAIIGIVDAIAVHAQKANHHPDILIFGWNKLRVTLSTHDKGGLTELDFQLAKQIEQLNY